MNSKLVKARWQVAALQHSQTCSGFPKQHPKIVKQAGDALNTCTQQRPIQTPSRTLKKGMTAWRQGLVEFDSRV